MVLRYVFCFAVMYASQAYADAEPLKMMCHNSKASYVLTFDPDAKTLVMDQADIHSAYVITRLQSDEDGVMLAAKTSLGTQIVVSFQKDKWVRTFYGNGSSLVDRCE
jgi:hypothetical protein